VAEGAKSVGLALDDIAGIGALDGRTVGLHVLNNLVGLGNDIIQTAIDRLQRRLRVGIVVLVMPEVILRGKSGLVGL
jgi:hypothetical protein